MTGHVLASGELIGLGQADPDPGPRVRLETTFKFGAPG